MADVDEPSRSKAKDMKIAVIPKNMADVDEPSGSKTKDIEPFIPCNVDDVDEPGTSLPTTVVDSSTCGGKINQASEPAQISNEVVVQCDAGAALIDRKPYEDQNLQFVKSSEVLRLIQTMEVFQSMPQEPHFRPLAEREEIWREGLAIGHMMTFVNVVKKTSKLQVNAPKSDFDSMFKHLDELELHGFNVKAVRSRLLEMQSIKRSEERLIRKSEKIERRILKETRKKTKLKAEIDGILKKLKVLEEKKAKLISKSNENDLEIAKLKSRVDLLMEEMHKVKHEFESLADSPWK